MRPDDDLEEIKHASSASSSRISTEIVVADTSPLNYLFQIDCDYLLPLLYRRVIVPPIVVAELINSGAPPIVARWAAQPPIWLEVLSIGTRPDEKLCQLDAGERDAIQLAIELHHRTYSSMSSRGGAKPDPEDSR